MDIVTAINISKGLEILKIESGGIYKKIDSSTTLVTTRSIHIIMLNPL